MKVEQYLATLPPFTPKAFNIKGNPANKEVIQDLVAKHGFKNEGQALDYVFVCFNEIRSKAFQIAEAFADTESLNKISALTKENGQLTKDKQALEAQLKNSYKLEEGQVIVSKEELEVMKAGLPEQAQKLKEHIEQEYNVSLDTLMERAKAADALLANPLYIDFKAETEKVLPRLLNVKDVQLIPISDEDMLNMLVDYAHRDPSKEFPMEQFAVEAYKKFKAKKNEPTGPVHEQQQQEEPIVSNTGPEGPATGGGNAGNEKQA